MSESQLSMFVVIEPGSELDDEDRERLGRRLRAELEELDVDSINLNPGERAPDGSKAADPLILGAILVAFSASGDVFTAPIDTLRDWLGRQSGRHRISVTIDGDTIELERATAGQQRDLVEAYIHRHSQEG